MTRAASAETGTGITDEHLAKLVADCDSLARLLEGELTKAKLQTLRHLGKEMANQSLALKLSILLERPREEVGAAAAALHLVVGQLRLMAQKTRIPQPTLVALKLVSDLSERIRVALTPGRDPEGPLKS